MSSPRICALATRCCSAATGCGRWCATRRCSNILNEVQDPAEACDLLIQRANENGGEDNITAVLVRCVLRAEGSHEPGLGNRAGWTLPAARTPWRRRHGQRLQGRRPARARADYWALKVLLDDRTMPAEERAWALKRFEDEIALLATLHHPRIPAYIASFVDRGCRCFVMEIVPGETLEERLERAHGAAARARRAATG